MGHPVQILLSSVGPVFKARFATPFAKQTGLQKPLNVSDTGQDHRHQEGGAGVQATGGYEALGLAQGEGAAGQRGSEMVQSPRQDDGACLWHTERQKCFGMSKHLKEHLSTSPILTTRGLRL